MTYSICVKDICIYKLAGSDWNESNVSVENKTFDCTQIKNGWTSKMIYNMYTKRKKNIYHFLLHSHSCSFIVAKLIIILKKIHIGKGQTHKIRNKCGKSQLINRFHWIYHLNFIQKFHSNLIRPKKCFFCSLNEMLIFHFRWIYQPQFE